MIVVDTGVLVALADSKDEHHQEVSAWIEAVTDDLLVPPTVIAEVCYLIGERGGNRKAEAEFLLSFSDDGGLLLAELTAVDLARMAELVERYADVGLGGTDASVIAIAERLGISQVATTDRRHFPIVIPNHVAALSLLP